MRTADSIRAVAFLAVLALAAGIGGASPDDPPGPVFFEDPDPATRKEIDRALELMRRPYISDHTRAREALTGIGYWSVRPLLERLEDGNAAEQRNAALILGTIGDVRALSPLIRVAETSAHLYTPTFATLMIGRFRRAESVSELESLVKTGKKTHRKIAAVLAVTKIRAPESWDVLVRILKTEKRDLVLETATFCLGFFRDRALVPGEDGRPVPCPELERALRSRETGKRRSALLALALLGHRNLKELYLRHANIHEDTEIRKIALLALGRFADRDVTELYVGILGSPKEPGTVKVTAALLLKGRRDAVVLKKLLRLNPPSGKLKAAVTLALANFESREVCEKLTHRLTDASDQVRAAAAIALSELRKPELKQLAIRRLTEMLKHPLDEDVRHNMRRAKRILEKGAAPGSFVWLGNEEFAADLPKDVEEKLLDLVNREVERVLGTANITDWTVGENDPNRVDDKESELRDLKEYLARHPYFEPLDTPEPDMAITPKERPVEGGGR